MSFKDVIKSSVYKQLGGGTGLSTWTIVLLLLASVAIGSYIFFIYKNQSKAAFYSRDLNITIAGMPIVVCAIMIAMQSNLIVSLGMVGALSIVRFRNAVKNPLDLLYLFWSISAGIICGVGLIVLAVILCVTMTAMILILHMIPNSKASTIVVIRASDDKADWNKVRSILNKYAKNVKQKSKNLQMGHTETIYEMMLKNEEEMIKDLKQIASIEQINVLSHDGEYRI